MSGIPLSLETRIESSQSFRVVARSNGNPVGEYYFRLTYDGVRENASCMMFSFIIFEYLCL
ncbi:MAG: hypothetical protein ABIA93_03720 [Candidatus Woesearchaeota archaeon]